MTTRFSFRSALIAVAIAFAAPTFAVSSNGAVCFEAPQQIVNLPAGTQVTVTLNEPLDADQVAIGNAVDFNVRSNVLVNGKVLIAAGATATGWVKNVKKSCGGKCLEITLTVESATAVDGQTVNLRSIPHVVKAPCCDGATQANIGTNLTARVLNDIQINA